MRCRFHFDTFVRLFLYKILGESLKKFENCRVWDLTFPRDLDVLDFEFDESGDELSLSLLASYYVPIPASLLNINPAALNLPPTETPTKDDLRKFEESRQSKATKSNTRGGREIFTIYVFIFACF